MSTVLVTGGSGFLATHCIMQLLAAGYDVRTTVRNVARERDVRAPVAAGGLASATLESPVRESAIRQSARVESVILTRLGLDVYPCRRLTFALANLEADAGWTEAVAGCDYVLHVASPFPAGVPADENELIIPAREGTLRVLRAARDAGVRRVVLTSSFAAIGYGHGSDITPFDESVWTNLAAPVSAYVKSKTLAERAAWDFIASDGEALELSVINPVGIFGPVLSAHYASSIALLKQMLEGKVPGCPKLYFGVVDVRDVADLHLRAMTNPLARDERFLAVAGDFLSVADMAHILKRRLGTSARRVHSRTLPNWLVRLTGVFNASVRQTVPELGKMKNATNEKARQLLDWQPRPAEEALVASAESLIRLGLVKVGA